MDRTAIVLAILRAQWLSMRLRVGTRRSGLIFGAITSVFFYGVWTVIALGALSFFADRDSAGVFAPVISSGLLFVMLYWQLAPVVSAGFGASLELRKLLPYPIDHGTLFLVEVMLRLSTCGEMLLLIGGASIGLLRNPLYGARILPYLMTAVLAFTATNLILSAGIRQLLERLFLRTRMREAMMFLVFVSALLPQIFFMMRVRRATLLHAAPEHILWPWAATASLMLGTRVAASLGLSLVYLALAWFFGRRQFERSIRYEVPALKPRRDASSRGFAEGLFRLPGRILSDPVGALMEKELRTLARIPRFRMVYVMSCVFGMVVYLPTLHGTDKQSFFMQNALPVIALYGLLMLGPISYWNAFGFDRSAVEGYFSWPIRFRDTLIAKNLTVALLIVPQIVMISIMTTVARMPMSGEKFLETFVVILVASLYWFAVGNIWSVRIPRAMDPDKMNQMTGKMQSLSIFLAPLLLFPLALAYWGRAVFESQAVFGGLLIIAGAVGIIVYKIGLDSAVSTATGLKREAMLQQLARSEGPMSIT